MRYQKNHQSTFQLTNFLPHYSMCFFLLCEKYYYKVKINVMRENSKNKINKCVFIHLKKLDLDKYTQSRLNK